MGTVALDVWRAAKEHEYIRSLRSQIRRDYSDLARSAEIQKQYSSTEWDFCLQLLGNDETRSDLNRLASRELENDGGIQAVLGCS
ncbi:hypothetical protein LTR96_011336, partial [Exophiala xenobiotica]